MNDSLYIAATGMHSQQKSVDTIAHNLANVNTPGFKKGKINFADMVYRQMGRAAEPDGSWSARSMWQGSGVSASALLKVFTPGDLRKTEAPLDLAIQGEGFLEVSAADGAPAYSRGGALSVDKEGFLATAEGHRLQPGIHVGQEMKELLISADGRVMARSRDQREASEVGRIELLSFSDSSALQALGANLYRPSERSGDAIAGKPGEEGLGTLAQGFLEASNVRLIEEMVDLMAAQRAYESSAKVIQASDELLAMSNNLRK
ncbi:flagellar basal-body rod protein FlgG [Massilia sp. BJB1822]|uniref:flagellar basal-body rod protein FlgG n=1 Tax=Massilia sp. BJB1822 TaxID=2744470 RepID=UPI001593841C|nr:flagellar basal-body rod protein FlgG [Massilia sp. BJB1822]NVE01293.1 flagellar basal-body rod protein FlgG [Massilia sp. BJB1822]